MMGFARDGEKAVSNDGSVPKPEEGSPMAKNRYSTVPEIGAG